MARSNIVTVGTTATLLNALPDSSRGFSSIAVLSPSAILYVGDASVTTANGWPLAAGSPLTLDLDNNETVYGVVASGTAAINVLQSAI